ncbi:uncharacterized protein E6C27_scaffold30G001910 [Cucumis melo var. makuwa]|uniref:Ubiquitin-like protease family profile domain-containing protein n=1 Tax=Cucumis melo var. makuwa TaxID=1194695 RepID=A0A5A7TPT6_CUCMM|nr:uncharacterized protein E6C27_scaffold30G001910 [Cucumis melo var. makuwa]
MAKRIKELEDELLKMKEKDDFLGDLKEELGMGSKEKSSMKGAENVNDLEDLSNDLESRKDVEDVVELNEDIKVNIVKDDEEVEGVMLEKMKVNPKYRGDNGKVVVDVVVDGDCAIPIPSEQGMYKMSQEMDYGEFTKDMTIFAPTLIQNAPVALRFLLRMVEHMGNHWTLVVINLTKGAAFWIDTLKNRIDPDVTEVVERSFNIRNKNKPNWRVVKCPKQSGVVECGYYVMWFMRDIIISRSTSIIQIMKDSPRAYTQDDIDCIRSEWAEFVGKHCIVRSILLLLAIDMLVGVLALSFVNVVDHEVLLKCVVDKKVTLKCVVHHEVLLKCVVDHEVLLIMKCCSSVYCVVDNEVLLKCVVDKKMLLKCVVDYEVLLKYVVDHEVLLKCCVVDHEVLLKFRNEFS